jgi:hypothetical protein
VKDDVDEIIDSIKAEKTTKADLAKAESPKTETQALRFHPRSNARLARESGRNLGKNPPTLGVCGLPWTFSLRLRVSGVWGGPPPPPPSPPRGNFCSSYEPGTALLPCSLAVQPAACQQPCSAQLAACSLACNLACRLAVHKQLPAALQPAACCLQPCSLAVQRFGLFARAILKSFYFESIQLFT